MRVHSLLLLAMLPCSAVAESMSVSELVSADIGVQSDQVVLRDELDSLFASMSCQFPERLAKRLKESGAVIPAELVRVLGEAQLLASVDRVDEKNVRAVMHGAEFEIDGKKTPFRLMSANTVNRLSPLSMVDPNSNNFTYTLDCSAYFNSALAVTAGLSGNDLKAAARQALAADKSLLVAKGSLFSPVAIALYPNAAPTALAEVDQADVLFALVQEVLLRHPNAPDSTIVRAPRVIDTIWTSNEGRSKLHGVGSLAGQGGFNAGFASVSGSADGGVELGKTLTFASFNTYLVAKPELAASSTLGQIQERVRSLVSAIPATRIVRESETYLADYALPRNICALKWTIKPAANGSSDATVVSRADGNACRFEIRPQGSSTALANGFVLQSTDAMGPSSAFELRGRP